jgi:hypothetical protein
VVAKGSHSFSDVLALLLLVLAEAGCVATKDVPDAGTLNCEFLTGDNCWRASVAAVLGCLPPSTERGTFGVDGESCVYPSGTTITFAEPVRLTGGAAPSGLSPKFTIENADTQCLQADVASGMAVLTSPLGTVRIGQGPMAGTRTLTCPDGTSYIGSAEELATCDNVVPSVVLDVVSESNDASGDSYLRIVLQGTDNPNGTVVFDCVAQ